MKIETKMVINTCFGGFQLSHEAAYEIARRKGLELEKRNDGLLYVKDTYNGLESILDRNDPDLVEVVEQMGKKANGSCSDLKVVNVAVYIETEDHEGIEKVTSYCVVEE